MELSYEIIRKLHRQEIKEPDLVKLPDNFFNEIKDFLENSQKNVQSKQYSFEDDEFRKYINVKKMIDDIFNLRYTKIIKRAISSAKGNDKNFDNLSGKEIKIYDDLVKNTQKYLVEFKTEKEIEDKQVNLEITKEIPKFIGTDMAEYGPYKIGDKVTLPANIAKIFISKELGKDV